jgi:hypothetical protein
VIDEREQGGQGVAGERAEAPEILHGAQTFTRGPAANLRDQVGDGILDGRHGWAFLASQLRLTLLV